MSSLSLAFFPARFAPPPLAIFSGGWATHCRQNHFFLGGGGGKPVFSSPWASSSATDPAWWLTNAFAGLCAMFHTVTYFLHLLFYRSTRLLQSTMWYNGHESRKLRPRNWEERTRQKHLFILQFSSSSMNTKIYLRGIQRKPKHDTTPAFTNAVTVEWHARIEMHSRKPKTRLKQSGDLLMKPLKNWVTVHRSSNMCELPRHFQAHARSGVYIFVCTTSKTKKHAFFRVIKARKKKNWDIYRRLLKV